jgi:mannan endo-1,4-beta-mannosidase
MQRLLDAVRASGNDSIVVVPGSHMGQGTEVWLTHGPRLRDPKGALLFDLHAYERWLLDRTPDQAAEALDRLDEAGLAWMVGEIAPMNAGALMDPRPFLALPQVRARPVAAWLWKRSDSDPDALLTSDGAPHDVGNHAWGSSFREYAAGR